jgi:hypothetical protein
MRVKLQSSSQCKIPTLDNKPVVAIDDYFLLDLSGLTRAKIAVAAYSYVRRLPRRFPDHDAWLRRRQAQGVGDPEGHQVHSALLAQGARPSGRAAI